MGAVYEVLDVRTASPRALKIILPDLVGDAEIRARFELEAKVTGTIQSEHLVRVTDAGVDPATGTPFLVMDLLAGEELGGLVERRGGLPAAEVAVYLFQAALALDKTHAAGIVHRDLKPENLFVVRRDDGSPCVKVLDFGIAKVVADSSRGKQTRPLGTPLYMSPEQIMAEGPIDGRADMYALGHIAYTLLTGEPFWTEEAESTPSMYALLARIMVRADEKPSARARRRRGVALPPAFDDWFAQSTAAAPGARFERASVAIAALARALGVTVTAPGLAAVDRRGASDPALSPGFARTLLTPVEGARLPAGSRRRPAVILTLVGFGAGAVIAALAIRGVLRAQPAVVPVPAVDAVTASSAASAPLRTADPPPASAPEVPAAPAASATVTAHATAAPRIPVRPKPAHTSSQPEGIY
jgi:serine/threonine-protein kinase